MRHEIGTLPLATNEAASRPQRHSEDSPHSRLALGRTRALAVRRGSRLVAWLPAETSAPEVPKQREHDQDDHDDPDQVTHCNFSLNEPCGERSSSAMLDS